MATRQEDLIISKGTKVTLHALLVLISIGVSVGIWAAGSIIKASTGWVRMEHDIVDLRRDVKQLSLDLDQNSVHRYESVQRWAQLLGAMNPDLNIPELP